MPDPLEPIKQAEIKQQAMATMGVFDLLPRTDRDAVRGGASIIDAFNRNRHWLRDLLS